MNHIHAYLRKEVQWAFAAATVESLSRCHEDRAVDVEWYTPRVAAGGADDEG